MYSNMEVRRQEAKRLFEPFFDKIKDKRMKEFAEYLFDQLPDYWFVKSASSTGKYHPKFANGNGGLVRHTLAMCKIWETLYRGFPTEFMGAVDILGDGLIACIFHDALKYGTEETFPDGLSYTTKGHESDAADWFLRQFGEYYKRNGLDKDALLDDIERIEGAIRYHMGPWSKEGAPKTFFEQLIFIADYMASSKWHEEGIFWQENFLCD